MKVFRLSVACDGTVNLWDSSEQRENGAESGEAFLDMPLTLIQEGHLRRAYPPKQSESEKLGSVTDEMKRLEAEVIRLRKGWSTCLQEKENLDQYLIT